GRLEGVVVVLALVVDAAHPRPHHEVLVGQDLVPEVVDLLHLGEEAVAADVEAPAVALDGAADAPDDVVGLEDGRGDAELGELDRRRESGGAGSDDVDVGLLGGAAIGVLLVWRVGHEVSDTFSRGSPRSGARGGAAPPSGIWRIVVNEGP